jgi:hypothetical protein
VGRLYPAFRLALRAVRIRAPSFLKIIRRQLYPLLSRISSDLLLS